MRGNRTDSNQTELVKYFRAWGCSVLIIADLKNCCDLVVSKHGRSIFVEVKDGAKPKSARKLTSTVRRCLKKSRLEFGGYVRVNKRC